MKVVKQFSAKPPFGCLSKLRENHIIYIHIAVMPEGEKHWGGGPVVIGGDNLPSLVQIGLTDLTNIGGTSGPPAPPSPRSGITDVLSMY